MTMSDTPETTPRDDRIDQLDQVEMILDHLWRTIARYTGATRLDDDLYGLLAQISEQIDRATRQVEDLLMDRSAEITRQRNHVQ